MTTETKYFEAEVKVIDEAQGVVTAFVNTMGLKDADGDIIVPTAFDRSIESNLPIPVLAGHDQSQVVGKVITAYPIEIGEEEHRLHATMQMNLDTESGRDAFSNIAGQFVRQWSVGFNVPEGAVSMERSGTDMTRVINDLDWVEVSTVIRGASPDTGTLSAKAEEIVSWEITKTVEHIEPDPEGSLFKTDAKPFPNFHACRVHDPGSFDQFRTTTETIEEGEYDGKQIELVWGRGKESGDWEIASYHLPREEWSESEGRSFCRSHRGILFEPATREETAPDTDATASDTELARARLSLTRVQMEIKAKKPKKKPKY